MTQYEFDNMLKALRQEHEERAAALRKELQALNEEYAARKKAIIEAFPNIKGVRKPGGVGHCHELHSERVRMIKALRESYKDDPTIDIEHINVRFRIADDGVTFETTIPKKSF